MSKLESFTRQRLIIAKLQKQACTFDAIDTYLQAKGEADDRKYDCDIRTFQRDVKEIAALFNIQIVYSKRDKVYTIQEDEMEEIGFRLLESYDIYKTINDFDKASKYVHFSTRKAIGTHHIYSILNAIQTKKMITFSHYNYWTSETSTFKIAPYALKEFNGRWYLIGLFGEKILSFGLDRVVDLELNKTKFIYPKDFSIDSLYKNSFGIHATNDEKPEKISFITNINKGNYFKSMPLHHSQSIAEVSKNEIEISVFIAPTYDFMMELLSHGDAIRITAPKHYVKTIKAQVTKMTNLYK
jgi:WYL domain